MLKVFECFAGIGSQRMALRNLGIEHEVVGIAEIDKFALKSYEAIHGDCPNFGDISKINPNDLPNMDLFTYSFPCQDLSVAGKQRGLGEGTRSGLLYECEKVIEAKRPKYLLLENVKNLVGKKFKDAFDNWLEYLEGLGYANYWKVLNAKDYGVAQNRERVFVISILKELDTGYEFPKHIKLDKVIKDILENEVDEKYYMNKPFKLVEKGRIRAEFTEINFEQTKRIYGIDSYFQTLSAADRGCNNILIEARLTDYPYKQVNQILSKDGICVTLDTMQGGHREPKVLIPQATKKGFIEMEVGGVCDLSYPNSKTRRGRVQENGTISPTLTASSQDIVSIDSQYRVRKLTPLECWRLMSFTDEDFHKAKNSGLSNSQLYKQAGNSIVVKVLEGIFSQLFLNEKVEELRIDTDFRNDGNEQFKWIV
ncbi:DNA cytosine methyltransferase [Romboutsia sp.]|uniref:DNA cytosine methyltransferase n=1 Tax=Romboutsia sp. TaxID=1965302 RepID=UPI002C7725AD|nr:DNA cytosine methyltransferase [Romboutsia sp.]HSQ90534.1 DNA cytosine methyltransferase [Romboutsia sp.]